MKLHSLVRTKADKARDEDRHEEMMEEMREPEGVEVHLNHEHIQKMGLDKPPRSGSEVQFHGRGHVVSAHTEDVNGEQRHHMRVRLTHGAIEHDDDEPVRGGLRDELSRNAK